MGGSVIARIAAFFAGTFTLAYMVSFVIVAGTQHGDEQVSWPSAGTIALESLPVACITYAVGAFAIGVVCLIVWSLDQ